jgi:hypothetical protein
MDMFGGLTKTSSRIAIAAALGLTLGGIAMKASPAKAADLGGDCCADLEERVAELEATTVRKGNKKVSVTLSGWVVKTVNWWDDGDLESFAVGDKDYDLASRFAITGTATIAPGWTGGFNLTVTAPGNNVLSGGNTFGILSNQFNDVTGGVNADINALYSYIYVKSDKYGALNWGLLSPASDNPAVLADISGTVIESNAVFFEGPLFNLRPNGAPGSYAGLSGDTWLNFLTCTANGGVGADCFGVARPAVLYQSPTWGGFRFETSYGTVPIPNTPDHSFWDIAAMYNGDWGDFKVSAAYAFTWSETAAIANPTIPFPNENNFHQVGATVMHVPSGLGVYGEFEAEQTDFVPDSDMWYVKPFIKRTWLPAGATVFYGEYGQYNDQYANLVGVGQCAALGLPGTNIGAFCGAVGAPVFGDVFVTSSEVQRWGLGVVQEIDSAAMHLFARWQHQDIGIDFRGVNFVTGASQNIGQGFNDWDDFQVGGIMFF